jgi:hypothetical protein
VDNVHGVKWVLSGIVFEKFGLGGEQEWRTAQGGVVVDESEPAIYRVDVTPAKFEDVQVGDKLTVTTKTGNLTTIVEDVALTLVNESLSPFWVGTDGHVILFKHVHDSVQTIEIERGE